MYTLGMEASCQNFCLILSLLTLNSIEEKYHLNISQRSMVLMHKETDNSIESLYVYNSVHELCS